MLTCITSAGFASVIVSQLNEPHDICTDWSIFTRLWNCWPACYSRFSILFDLYKTCSWFWIGVLLSTNAGLCAFSVFLTLYVHLCVGRVLPSVWCILHSVSRRHHFARMFVELSWSGGLRRLPSVCQWCDCFVWKVADFVLDIWVGNAESQVRTFRRKIGNFVSNVHKM